METAKLFMTGGSQAVRLPKKFRFSGTEVEIKKQGDNIILSPISGKEKLKAFLAMPSFPDFAIERESVQEIQQRDLF